VAFPQIETQTESSEDSASTTSHTVSLPSGIQSGDLLLILFTTGDATTQDVTWPMGWTEIVEVDNTGGGDQVAAVAYREADGGEGATITVTTDTDGRSAHQALRISGAEDPDTQAPEEANDSGNNASADCPDLTPTGGAQDYTWFAFGANSIGGAYTGFPTSYDDSQSQLAARDQVGNANDTCGVVSTRELNAASENPASYTHDQAATSEWVGITVAVHPGAAAGAPTFVAPVGMHRVSKGVMEGVGRGT